MQLVQSSGTVKVAEIYAYDTSRQLCDSDYFFMEKLPGKNYIFCKEEFSKEENAVISKEMGEIQKRLTGIRGKKFGLLKYEEKFDTLYEFIYFLIANVVNDAEKKDVEIGISKEVLLKQLEKDRILFDEVCEPTLVHWDMWDGNVFVENKHIVGIIDWERALWGESYMDDHFRRHVMEENFLKGYGKTEFTLSEKKRMLWYDILLYLIMMTEVTYRQYEDKGQYFWAAELMKKSWQDILEFRQEKGFENAAGDEN